MNTIQIEALVKQMTRLEKIGQMTQITTSFFNVDGAKATGTASRMKDVEQHKWIVGSVLGKLDAASMLRIQRDYLQHNRLGIPLLFMTDVVHGYKTIFPVPLALSCSWNPEVLRRTARVSALEAAAAGFQVTFSPMVDLVRDPRWGRVMESFGEDRLLLGQFGAAMVEGYQTDDLQQPDTLAACVKHFAGYGAAEGGKDYNTVDLSPLSLYNDYLPAYHAALQAGARLMMAAFNTLNGVPATANTWLLQDILRKQWGFDGTVISDWGAVKELIPHGVAAGSEDAARLSLQAGIEIEMMTTAYIEALPELCEQHPELEQKLDEAVTHILQLKQELGLFDDPYRGVSEAREQEMLLHPSHRQAAREAAVQSMVLLKNQNVLPLNPDHKLALIGPFADNQHILGPWSVDGDPNHTVTVLEGLNQQGVHVQSLSTDDTRIDEDALHQAIELIRQSDIVVLALGEREEWSGEAGSRASIGLPPDQLKLLRIAAAAGKPVIVVMFAGRPIELAEVAHHADAILMAWFPGTEGGHAIADILTGRSNPSGRLTMSFPYHSGQIPVHYNHLNTGRPAHLLTQEKRYKTQYLDVPNESLYPFGYGLGYSEFVYGDIDADTGELSIDRPLQVSIPITNNGDYTGCETVQVYIHDRVAEIARPVRELIAYRQIELKPGETARVEYTISAEMLGYYHTDLQYRADPGEFELIIGPDSHRGASVMIRIV